MAEYRSKHVIQFGRRFVSHTCRQLVSCCDVVFCRKNQIGVMKGSDLTYWMEEKCLSGIVEDVDMLLSMDKMEADDDSKVSVALLVAADGCCLSIVDRRVEKHKSHTAGPNSSSCRIRSTQLPH